jgi:hypothetical protein
MKTKQCPICEGKGVIEAPYQNARDECQERREMARTLREAGYSIRQIARALGYKSPRSVVLALEAQN